MGINNENLKEFLSYYNNNCYICKYCKTIIFPNISIEGDVVNLELDRNSVHGGRGNKNLLNDVCNDCMDKIRKIT